MVSPAGAGSLSIMSGRCLFRADHEANVLVSLVLEVLVM